jgi:CBS domain-containing protein
VSAESLNPPVEPLVFLARHAPFDALSAVSLRALGGTLEIRYAEPGDVLLARGGSPSDALWVVRKGRVHLERDGLILDVLHPGECFGYPSLLGKRPPERDAVAVESTLLLRIPETAFRGLLKEPNVARFFLDGLAARLRLSSAETAPSPIRGLGRRPVATLPSDASVEAAARAMRDGGVGSLLVTREAMPLGGDVVLADVVGIVTDRDLRDRVLAAGRPASTPLGDVASRGLHTLDARATTTDALLALARHGVRHLPLVEGDRVVGLVSASDLMQRRSLDPLALRRDVERLPLADLLPGWTDRLRRAIGDLVQAKVDGERIGQIVATLGDALARRLLSDARQDPSMEGLEIGWLVHGSEGREEQLLPTDQDNALVYQALGLLPEAAAERAQEVARRVVDGLLKAGYPECPGGYMATRWCDSLDGWVERFRGWAALPRDSDRLDFSTFLDLRQAAGDLDVASLRVVRAELGANRHLLRGLAGDAAKWTLPLGLFGELREGDEGFDLKRGSLLVVAVARLAALEAGSSAGRTLDRLREAAPVLGDDAATLAEAFRYLTSLRLELAFDPARRGVGSSGHRIHLAHLNVLERRFLKDIFTLLRGVQKGLDSRYAL